MPAYVAFDKKVLRFFAYFLEDVWNSPDEDHRIRSVVIYYYLEDDSMCIWEAAVMNSGISQGKRLKRHRVPKNDRGDYYHWKDFNLGIDLEMYGCKYHITHCDTFTKDFMEHEGIVLNEPEPLPEDPYIKHRQLSPPPRITSPTPDITHRFLTTDLKVLRFYALYDKSPSEDPRPMIIYYYLVDDTVEISEVHEHNSGRNPSSRFLRRQKIPKKLKSEFYSPVDFAIGATVEVFGHRFVLIGAAPQVLKYLESISSKIPSHTLDSLRRTLGEKMAENQPDEQNGEEPKSSPK
uniref:EF-hand domain (C-terminal) containing 1 n=1 Tax=Nothobranchius korthausae TaxID=1143690 RepID=A0A1A8HB66_9TELE